MRSIRHPHLLTFYGAGVDKDNRAYLVVELMKGSLGEMLRDPSQDISWDRRLTFASDCAHGMSYLHEKDTVHRDLKADNCFVGEDMRVKVADFGTGRIAKHLQDGHPQVGSRSRPSGAVATPTATPLTGTAALAWFDASAAGRTLSTGVGSLFWMAPEALRGSRLREGQATALDVYSYGIVLWELWCVITSPLVSIVSNWGSLVRGRGRARDNPWNEIDAHGIKLSSEIVRLVHAGVRPRLPDGCGPAPEGYRDLMEKSWAGRPETRPSFSIILTTLTKIGEQMTEISESDL